MIDFKESAQYAADKDSLKMVRDSLEGEPAIKAAGQKYLSHPSHVDTTSESARKRYKNYKESAEFDGYPEMAINTEVGQLTSGEMVLDLPERVGYLTHDADGNGLPLAASIESTMRELMIAKYHILVVEYTNTGEIAENGKATLDAIKRAKPRAFIKHYLRESLIDWQFGVVDGVNQLVLAVFREDVTVRDLETLEVKTVERFMVMRLGDDGYSQAKYEKDANGKFQEVGERAAPKVDGKELRWMPILVVSDENALPGQMPAGQGWVYPVVAKTMYRYRNSARYNEIMASMPPTWFGSGWKDGDEELFKKINGGREGIDLGLNIMNNLPDGVTVDIKSPGASVDHYERYFARNEAEIMAAMNRSDGDGVNGKSATQAAIDNASSNGVKLKVVKNTQEAYKMAVGYCAMFDGLFSADEVEARLDEINISLPTTFGLTMTADEKRSLCDLVASRVMSRAEALRQVERSGGTVADFEQIMGEIETNPDIV